MKIGSYEVSFSVEYFMPTEGGMEHEIYGYRHTLEDAISLLEYANQNASGVDWVIVCNVYKRDES